MFDSMASTDRQSDITGLAGGEKLFIDIPLPELIAVFFPVRELQAGKWSGVLPPSAACQRDVIF